MTNVIYFYIIDGKEPPVKMRSERIGELEDKYREM